MVATRRGQIKLANWRAKALDQTAAAQARTNDPVRCKVCK